MKRAGTTNAKRLRRRMTDAEWRLWLALRDRRLARFKFKRQVPVDPWVVDFLCAELMLVVEVDGGQHGGQRDAKRDADLRQRGYRVVRYWNNDVLANTEGVLTHLLGVLNDET